MRIVLKPADWLGIGLSAALMMGACSQAETVPSDLVQIVTTTDIWGDVAANVAAKRADVTVLVPSGQDPHEYQASAQQLALLLAADLVVANGLGLEEGLEDVLTAAQSDGANVVFVADHLEGPQFGDADEGLDPHVWMDPTLVAQAAGMIAAELSKIESTTDWQSSAETYSAVLDDLDREIRRTIDAIPQGSRKLVTNHNFLEHFASRYGFAIVGTIIPGGSTMAEPSSAEIASLVDVIGQTGAPAIFTGNTESAKLAETVAAEVEIDIVDLYTGSLGGPGSGATSLVDMLITDTQLIAEALK